MRRLASSLPFTPITAWAKHCPLFQNFGAFSHLQCAMQSVGNELTVLILDAAPSSSSCRLTGRKLATTWNSWSFTLVDPPKFPSKACLTPSDLTQSTSDPNSKTTP